MSNLSKELIKIISPPFSGGEIILGFAQCSAGLRNFFVKKFQTLVDLVDQLMREPLMGSLINTFLHRLRYAHGTH